ncbi:hypothetical protein BASA81_004759 [Batrachochytrium salamandrivorans]|nr:hypothetical protein BASA81_004759 [Batrachochytrium salamandrivorans]
MVKKPFPSQAIVPKLPWTWAVICSILLVGCCFGPSTAVLLPRPVRFDTRSIFHFHPSNPAIWSESVIGNGWRNLVITQDGEWNLVDSESLHVLQRNKRWSGSPVPISMVSWEGGLGVVFPSGRVVGLDRNLNVLWELVRFRARQIIITREEGLYVFHDNLTRINPHTGLVMWESALNWPSTKQIAIQPDGVVMQSSSPEPTTWLNLTSGGVLGSYLPAWAAIAPNCAILSHHNRTLASSPTCHSTNKTYALISHSPIMIVLFPFQVVCLHANTASVLWRYNLTSFPSSTYLALEEQYLVLESALSLVAIRIQDGTTAAIQSPTPLRSFSTQTRLVEGHPSSYLPPLSLIPVLLSLVLLWAIVGFTKLD